MKRIFWWLFGVVRQVVKPPQGSMMCPWCGYSHDGEPTVHWLSSGSSFDGEATRYWAEGIAQCDRCAHRFSYSDSE